MSEQVLQPPLGPDPCTPRQVESADGAVVRFCAHGGHVLGWTPAGGNERLWLSRTSGCGAGTAVRGGIPVIWPQFAARGDGPRHGIARDRAWSVLSAGTDRDGTSQDGRGRNGAARLRLELRADAATRVLFPHPFTLTLDIEASGPGLVVALEVRNEGVDALTFAAALHTYLRVSAVGAVAVHGLQGRTAEPNGGGSVYALPVEPLQLTGPLDVAVPDVDGAVVVDDPVLGRLTVEAEGFESRVVWNPGPDAVPTDVHPGGEDEFLCVEPALLRPSTLAPGESWHGRQVLTAQAAGG